MTSCPISHNWPLCDFSVEIYAGLCKVKRAEPVTGNKGGGLRAAVSAFSAQSRKRMLERMASARSIDSGYFCTMTYPGDFRWSWQECKAHLATLRKRILRKFPQARVLWRMELKLRLSGVSIGECAPHFHFLIYGLPMGKADKLEVWLTENWDVIANNEWEEDDILRCDVQEIISRKATMGYVGKYTAKIDDGINVGFGRHWGFFGNWDFSMSTAWKLNQLELIQFKRLCRSWARGSAFARQNRLEISGNLDKAEQVRKKSDRFLRRMAKIRPDFGVIYFGLGDGGDLTLDSARVLQLLNLSQRI